MSDFDIIIIGGGLGGLVAGARLSKEGKKVLLLEQHHVPGGCATTFKRGDFIIEAGLHAMDGLDEKDPKSVLINDLDVLKNVEFLKIPEFYRFKNGRVDIVIPGNTKEAIKVLVKNFPDEKKGITRFFKKIHAIQRETSRFLFDRRRPFILFPLFPFKYPNLVLNVHKTLGDILNKIITNEDLKLILQANLLYYHDNPETMSIIYFSAGQASYFNGGGHYIKGGAQKLADHFASIITTNGSKVMLRNRVTKILMKDKEAIGVEYEENNEIKTSYANTIIANSAVPNIINMMPVEDRSELNRAIKNPQKACSLLSIYLCFKNDIKELGSKHYSTVIFDEQIQCLKDVKENSKGSYEKRNFVFVDYSQIDSGLAPNGKSSGVICMIDYLSNWEKLNQEEYKTKKEEVAQIFIKRLEKLIPGITKEIEFIEVGTPKTIQKYTLNTGGSVYGYAQTPRQTGMYRIQHKSSIKNLYFASAWANPGGGFTGAMLSGWICASEVLRKK